MKAQELFPGINPPTRYLLQVSPASQIKRCAWCPYVPWLVVNDARFDRMSEPLVVAVLCGLPRYFAHCLDAKLLSRRLDEPVAMIRVITAAHRGASGRARQRELHQVPQNTNSSNTNTPP